jgi:hypothetical protein
MKKKTLLLTALAIICFMTFLIMVSVNAQIPDAGECSSDLINCYPMGVGTYTNTSIDISMNYYLLKTSTQVRSFSYSLDGEPNSTLSYVSKDGSEAILPSLAMGAFSKYIYYYIYGPLENLTNANHRLQVYAYLLNETTWQIWNQSFRVNTEFVPPKLAVISPQNQSTYNNSVPIVFNTNSKVIWAYYGVDSSSRDTWTPLRGNTTLTGLTEGYHTLTIFVVTEANTQSTQASSEQTIEFNFRSSQNNPLLLINNQSNMTLIAVCAVVIIVIVAVLLYFKNIKAKASYR